MTSINVHFSESTSNRKTGAMFVTTTDKATCPDTCPLKKKGCYAKYSFLGHHWNEVSNGNRNKGFDNLLKAVRNLGDNEVWRHNQAGDLFGINNDIDSDMLDKLATAATHTRGFTYTHKPLTRKNLKAILSAVHKGFTINLSSDNFEHADKLANKSRGLLPVVTMLPAETTEKVHFTPQGRRVVTCPQSYNDEMPCKRCKLCSIADRDYIIGFPLHGSAKKSAAAACSIK